MKLQPKGSGSFKWGDVSAERFPPLRFVAGSVHLAVMSPTERNGEFVADFAPHRAWLGEPQMMGIRRLPTAEQTRLGADEFQMSLAAAPWCVSDHEHAPIRRSGRFGGSRHSFASCKSGPGERVSSAARSPPVFLPKAPSRPLARARPPACSSANTPLRPFACGVERLQCGNLADQLVTKLCRYFAVQRLERFWRPPAVALRWRFLPD